MVLLRTLFSCLPSRRKKRGGDGWSESAKRDIKIIIVHFYVLLMRGHICFLFLGCIIACILVSSACAHSPEIEAQYEIAAQLYTAGKCPSALIASQKVIELDPQFAKAWNAKGSALHCLERNQEALEAFDKAIALDPTLDMPKKNKDHVLLDIQNGAPLTTPPIVLPEVRNTSIQFDGELGYVPLGELTGCWSLITGAHAVFYTNNKTIVVNGVRVAGCRYGKPEGNVSIQIWDKNLTTLFRDIIPYEVIPFPAVEIGGPTCISNSSWVDIGISDHEVTGDFYLVIHTDSYQLSEKEHGIFIVYSTPSETGTSYVVKRNPNRLTTYSIGGYNTSELDWMIRVVYKYPPTPVPTMLPPPTPTMNVSQAIGNEAVQSGQASATPVSGSTKSPIPTVQVLITLVFWVVYRKIWN